MWIWHFSRFFHSGLFRSGFFLGTKKIPVDYLDHVGIICEVQTEKGLKKFLIDTGSPSTVVKGEPNKKEILNTFVIGSKNYGPIQAVSIPMTLFKDFDGIIGMDLLYDKSLYIDFENKFICLEWFKMLYGINHLLWSKN